MQDQMLFEQAGYPFSLEYRRRTSPFSMDSDHYHAYYEIYYLLSGQRHYFIRDRSYLIRPGDLVFINKRELHKTTSAGDDSAHERLVIYFFDSFLRPAYEQQVDLLLSPFMRENPVCRLPLKEQMRADRIVEGLLQEMRDRLQGCEITLKHGITELMLLAARHGRGDSTSIGPLATPMHLKMSEIARYLNDHYAEPISLMSLADLFHISPYYLSRMFPKAVGLTVTEYVNLIRVKAAEQLLKDTAMSVTGVASAVGYDNFSHFGKMFKKITKMSPRAYRKS